MNNLQTINRYLFNLYVYALKKGYTITYVSKCYSLTTDEDSDYIVGMDYTYPQNMMVQCNVMLLPAGH